MKAEDQKKFNDDLYIALTGPGDAWLEMRKQVTSSEYATALTDCWHYDYQIGVEDGYFDLPESNKDLTAYTTGTRCPIAPGQGRTAAVNNHPVSCLVLRQWDDESWLVCPIGDLYPANHCEVMDEDQITYLLWGIRPVHTDILEQMHCSSSIQTKDLQLATILYKLWDSDLKEGWTDLVPLYQGAKTMSSEFRDDFRSYERYIKRIWQIIDPIKWAGKSVRELKASNVSVKEIEELDDEVLTNDEKWCTDPTVEKLAPEERLLLGIFGKEMLIQSIKGGKENGKDPESN